MLFVLFLWNFHAHSSGTFFDFKKKGVSIPLTDAIIAAIAIRNNALVFTLDIHFKDVSFVTNLDIYQYTKRK